MNKEGLLQAKKKLYDAVSASIQAYDEQETRLGNDSFLPRLRAVLAGAQGPAPSDAQAAAPARVCLNVGGTPFEVERAVLTAINGSRLGRVFEQEWDGLLPRDQSNRIFLDLDIEQFQPIVKWIKKYMAQDNLPEHPESMIKPELAEDKKGGFPALLAELGLGALGTVDEAKAIGTKAAFLAKVAEQQNEAVRSQIKAPVAEKIVQAIREHVAELKQNQPEQAATAEETVAVFEAMVQWDRALASKRAETELMAGRVDKEIKFLQHLAGQGSQALSLGCGVKGPKPRLSRGLGLC